jgi:hypothetical protein
MPCDTWHSPVCLPNVSQAGLELAMVVASVAEAAAHLFTCFLSVMWRGEAFYGLGVQDVKVLILFSASFLPSVAPVSQQYFLFTELTLSASVSYSPYGSS